jgi:hypothetical protein
MVPRWLAGLPQHTKGRWFLVVCICLVLVVLLRPQVQFFDGFSEDEPSSRAQSADAVAVFSRAAVDGVSFRAPVSWQRKGRPAAVHPATTWKVRRPPASPLSQLNSSRCRHAIPKCLMHSSTIRSISANADTSSGEGGAATPSFFEEKTISTKAFHGAVVSPRCIEGGSVSTYHEWFLRRVLGIHFGDGIAKAVYDPQLYNTMVQAAINHQSSSSGGAGGFWFEHDHDFAFDGNFAQPKFPEKSFSSISHVLWWAKRWATTAITKISRDSDLENLYRRLCVDTPTSSIETQQGLRITLFERTVVRAVSAQVQHFFTVLQLGIDATLESHQKHAFHKTVTEYHGAFDPLVLVCGWITHTTTLDDVATLLASSSAMSELIQKHVAQQSPASAAAPRIYAQSLYALVYNDLPFHGVQPSVGKFWNMFRPTAGCSSTIRSCEASKGCRFICNGEYLKHAGILAEEMRQQEGGATTNRLYNHRVIGMGGKEDYTWETSVVNFFQRGGSDAPLNRSMTHQLGWLSSMDCTVDPFRKKLDEKIPQQLRDSAIGYSRVGLCVGGSSTSGTTTLTDTIHLACLKEFQASSEMSWGDDSCGGGSSTSGPLIRYIPHPDALARRHQQQSFLMPPRPSLRGVALSNEVEALDDALVPGPRWFDDVTLLKLDIHGYEWNLLPTWLRDEFVSVGAHHHIAAMSSTAAIDFAMCVPHYNSVSQLSMELNRLSVHTPNGREALATQWLTMQTYALGFIMVYQERGDGDHHNSFEQTYVHVRHFIKSEMWMILRDEL